MCVHDDDRLPDAPYLDGDPMAFGEETLDIAPEPFPLPSLPTARSHGELTLEIVRLRQLLEAGAAAARHARELIRADCHATASAVLEVYARGVDAVLGE